MTLHDGRIGVVVAVLFAAPLAAFPASSHLGVEVGEPTVRIVDGPDEESDLLVSISVRVRNTTDRELAVDLIVQGVDRAGAEIHDLFLNEALKPGQERVFSDTDYIKQKLFKSIVVWRVEEATIRGGQPPA